VPLAGRGGSTRTAPAWHCRLQAPGNAPARPSRRSSLTLKVNSDGTGSTISCPSCFAHAWPSREEPVATQTKSHSQSLPSLTRTRNPSPPSRRASPSTRTPVRTATPASLAARSSAATMLSDESETGNTLPLGSTLSGTPSASNHARVSAADHPASGDSISVRPRPTG
jgi:hypothetical protein